MRRPNLQSAPPIGARTGHSISRTLLLGIVLALGSSPLLRAQSYSLLYSFQCGADASYPESALALDTAGNLYGTAAGGGTYGDGAVYMVSAAGAETVLHSFAGSPDDGAFPTYGTPIRDLAGNLYGTTPNGGPHNTGVVFKVAPDGTETVVHGFPAYPGDGNTPYAGLILDGAGNLYGTTEQGGHSERGGLSVGTVFEVTPSGVEKVVYEFGALRYGQLPLGGLVRDAAGNFYGTTYQGGSQDDGTVFRITPSGTESVLVSLIAGLNGENPFFGLLRDGAGNLYGSAGFGGASNLGTVFELTAAGEARLLHSFIGVPDGNQPYGSLVRDNAGNLYGSTLYGGTGLCNEGFDPGCGAIFKITPAGQESILYSFGGPPSDGEYPLAGLTIDRSGNLYGTTSSGGSYGCGTVFEYTP
jgi:uncharacterized repeat protein (TIGR03803 family)